MKILYSLIFILLGILTVSMIPGPVHAEQTDLSKDIEEICKYAGEDAGDCKDCAGNEGIWTAFGCMETSPSGLFTSIFKIFTGIAGGVAFLLILFGGFQIMTSAGNPEQLNAGRELITSAVAGLLLIIFSVFLLRLIGVDILGIPGFS